MTACRPVAAPLLSIALLLLPSVGRAQDTTARANPAEQLGQTAADVKSKISGSGMSPDQIRSALSAKGLDPSSLDSYLSGATSSGGGQDLPPNRKVLDAVAALSQADRLTTDAATREGKPSTIANGPTAIEGLEVFGMRTFQRGTNQFEPNLAGPVDQGYQLGPADIVAIIATGRVELSYALEVQRDGSITIPSVGNVFVGNLTLAQATQAVVDNMRRSYAGAGTGPDAPTRISVNVARLRTNQIFVLGDVAAPGSYQVSAAGTALTALYAAGGPTLSGSMRQVQVRRGTVVVSTIDIYDYLLRGDASHDIRLRNGDIIFVPANPKRVAITGEVSRPGMYEMRDNEMLAELLSTAGGLTPTAATQRIQISRIVPPADRPIGGKDRTMLDITGPELARGSARPTPLLAGDRVTVFGITSPARNAVTVTGNVWAPGTVALSAGMRLSDALHLVGGLKPDTYLDELQVTRLLPNQSREVVRIRLADTLGTPATDVPLQDGDSIRVFGAAEFRTTRNVEVAGHVRRPTISPFRTGMTFRDLLLIGGGVEDGTDPLDSVTVTRLQTDLTRRTFTRPLRDTGGGFATFALEAGDVVTVRARSEFRPDRFVTVGGGVRKPVSIPFSEGLTLRQAVQAAGGLKESALLTEVEIARMPDDRTGGKTAAVFRSPIDSSYLFERGPDGKYLGPPGLAAKMAVAPEVILRPYDHVNILEQPEWAMPGSVSIGGEVRYPGSYAIVNSGERISDLIARAGGLTDGADPDAVIFRRAVTPEEAANRAHLIERVRLDRSYALALERVSAAGRATTPGATETGAAASDEQVALTKALQVDSTSDRIAIDLAAVIRNPQYKDNLVLRAGDEIVLPRMSPTVTIRGFVNAPVTLPYRQGASLDDYIRGAGGVTQNGDPGRAFVQQPNGRIDTYAHHRLWFDTSPTPRAGAVIVVPPKEVHIAPAQSNSVFILSALASMATAAAAIISISR